MILPLFRVRISQPRQAPNLHPQRLVGALDMAGANAVCVRIAVLRRGYYVKYRGWRVTPIILRFAVDFHQGCVIHAMPQDSGNGREIGPVAIRGQLKAPIRGVRQFGGERSRILWRPLADVPSEDQLGMPLYRGKAPHVAKARGAIQSLARLFFAADEPPYFIALNVLDLDANNRAAQEPLALLASFDNSTDDRALADAVDALLRADRAALKNLVQDRQHRCRIDAPLILGPRLGIRKRAAARIAAIALTTVPIPAKAPHTTVAQRTEHGNRLFLFWRFG